MIYQDKGVTAWLFVIEVASDLGWDLGPSGLSVYISVKFQSCLFELNNITELLF